MATDTWRTLSTEDLVHLWRRLATLIGQAGDHPDAAEWKARADDIGQELIDRELFPREDQEAVPAAARHPEKTMIAPGEVASAPIRIPAIRPGPFQTAAR
jgi:hypothetical protein